MPVWLTTHTHTCMYIVRLGHVSVSIVLQGVIISIWILMPDILFGQQLPTARPSAMGTPALPRRPQGCGWPGPWRRSRLADQPNGA